MGFAVVWVALVLLGVGCGEAEGDEVGRLDLEENCMSRTLRNRALLAGLAVTLAGKRFISVKYEHGHE